MCLPEAGTQILHTVIILLPSVLQGTFTFLPNDLTHVVGSRKQRLSPLPAASFVSTTPSWLQVPVHATSKGLACSDGQKHPGGGWSPRPGPACKKDLEQRKKRGRQALKPGKFLCVGKKGWEEARGEMGQ